MNSILIIIVSIMIICIYFLPIIIGRHKKNIMAIGVINFFLGWTLIGWVLALIWAVMEEK